jgi:hypothetical protein
MHFDDPTAPIAFTRFQRRFDLDTFGVAARFGVSWVDDGASGGGS